MVDGKLMTQPLPSAPGVMDKQTAADDSQGYGCGTQSSPGTIENAAARSAATRGHIQSATASRSGQSARARGSAIGPCAA